MLSCKKTKSDDEEKVVQTDGTESRRRWESCADICRKEHFRAAS